MDSPLAALRHNAPSETATRFLNANPWSWIVYAADAAGSGVTQPILARQLRPAAARRMQRAGRGVFFSVQPFWESKTEDPLLCFRTLAVAVDLVAPPARVSAPDDAVDRRKDAYLQRILHPFPLRPQWLVETRLGFQVLFRVLPQRGPGPLQDALALNRRLARTLRGDQRLLLLVRERTHPISTTPRDGGSDPATAGHHTRKDEMGTERGPRKRAADRRDIARLEAIPNIGPAVAADLRQLGITSPGDLVGRDPYAMYDELCRVTGVRHDPCMLDTFIAAVRYMEGGPKKPWWAFTAERKREIAARNGAAK